jgi:hypothetical protein
VTSVGFAFRLVVVVDLSRVTVSVAGKVDQEDESDQKNKGEDKEADSPGLMINQETNEGDDGDDDTQNEKSSEVPKGETGEEGRDVFITEVNVSIVDDSETKDQEESASQEDQIRHGLVVPLQASESGSGTEEEEEEEKASDATLDDKVNSKEVDGAFEGGSFTETIVPGLADAVGGSSKIEGVLVLDVEVGQEEQRESRKEETEDEDGLGQVITRSGLEDISVGFVAVGRSGRPEDDGDGGDQEQSSGGDEEDDEVRVISAGVDAGEDQRGDGEDNGNDTQVSGPEDVVTTLLAVEEIVFFKVVSLFVMGEALTEVLGASSQTVLMGVAMGMGVVVGMGMSMVVGVVLVDDVGDNDTALDGSGGSDVDKFSATVLHFLDF